MDKPIDLMKKMRFVILSASLCLTLSNSKENIIEDHTQKSTYVDGVRHGMTWRYDNKHKIKSKVNFKDGKENGIYTSYYDNGKEKLVVEYVDGKKHNIQKTYYNNGQIGSQVTYAMGKREGLMTEWDLEGHKLSEVFYKHNYKVGIKKHYDHDGKVTFSQEFKMDRNPLMSKLLKDKKKEILTDLAKHDLLVKDTPEKIHPK